MNNNRIKNRIKQQCNFATYQGTTITLIKYSLPTRKEALMVVGDTGLSYSVEMYEHLGPCCFAVGSLRHNLFLKDGYFCFSFIIIIRTLGLITFPKTTIVNFFSLRISKTNFLLRAVS